MLWSARKQHVALAFISYIPFVIFAALTPASNATMIIFSVLWLVLWLVPMQILWQRLFLVGPDFFLKMSAQKLLSIWLRLIGYYLGLIVVLALAAMMVFAARAGLGWLWHFAFDISDPRIENLITLVAFMVFSFLGVFVMLRLAPIPVGITVEEHISPRHSWTMVRGQTFRLWLTTFLAGISSMLVISSILFSIFVTIGLISVAAWAIARNGMHLDVPGLRETAMLEGILNLLLSPFFSVMPALQMAVLAIIYRDLAPQPEHPVDVMV